MVGKELWRSLFLRERNLVFADLLFTETHGRWLFLSSCTLSCCAIADADSLFLYRLFSQHGAIAACHVVQAADGQALRKWMIA
jgi:hypothetical protein